MFDLPVVSSWAALHPGLSHFPITLLLAAPVLILVGLILPARRKGLFEMAVWIMAAGTLFIYLSASSGDAARDSAQRPPEIAKAIAAHESIGSTARAVFTVLAILLAGFVYGPGLLKRPLSPRGTVFLAVGFLVICAIASLLILNAAHSGGVLVHTLGVHAKLT
jgi:uncharacterized membrane protein